MRYDIVAGDLQPPLAMTLDDANGPVPLAGATITFVMQQADGIKRVSGPAIIDDLASASVHYQWDQGDTDVPGVYRAQIHAVYGGNQPETFPSDETFFVIIHPRL